MNIHCKYDELVDVKALKPHPKNRNKHPDDQIERLAKILKYQGIRAPIVVSKRSNKIVKGHGTLQAIKANQWDKAPVVYQDFEDDDQEWLFVQSDNAIASWAELDLKGINADIGELGPFDIDLIGIKDFVVEPAEKDLGDEESVPEIRETHIKLGDLFILGDHRLLCGDSTDAKQVEKLMGGEKADMVFTDPPYGVGLKYNQHDDSNLEDYYKLMKGWFNQAKKQSDFIAATVGHKNNNWWFKNFEPNSFLIWFDKTKQSPHSHAFLCKTELVLLWGKVPNGERYSWDILEITHDKVKDGAEFHACPKPIKLVEEILRPTTKKILDLFLGSGTTLIACEKTNRKCFGMELDPQYCQVIIDRWEQYTGKKAVKHG